MAFAGFTQTGHLWIPVGSPENLTGVPTQGDNVEVLDSQGSLEPNQWYTMTIECDYSTRKFISVKLQGGALDVEFDLSDKQLEYPNYVTYDEPAMTMYCFSSRSVSIAGDNKNGNSKVYFDDIEAGLWSGDEFQIILSESFENPNEIALAPYDFSAPLNQINAVDENIWYKENENALLSFSTKFSKTGDYSMECNSKLLK